MHAGIKIVTVHLYKYASRIVHIRCFRMRSSNEYKMMVVGLGGMYRENGWRGGIIGGGIF